VIGRAIDVINSLKDSCDLQVV